jgi:hypothetical protein
VTVTLSWPDPEDTSEFLRLRKEFRDLGVLYDHERDELLRLVGESVVVKDGSEEGSGDDG